MVFVGTFRGRTVTTASRASFQRFVAGQLRAERARREREARQRGGRGVLVSQQELQAQASLIGRGLPPEPLPEEIEAKASLTDVEIARRRRQITPVPLPFQQAVIGGPRAKELVGRMVQPTVTPPIRRPAPVPRPQAFIREPFTQQQIQQMRAEAEARRFQFAERLDPFKGVSPEIQAFAGVKRPRITGTLRFGEITEREVSQAVFGKKQLFEDPLKTQARELVGFGAGTLGGFLDVGELVGRAFVEPKRTFEAFGKQFETETGKKRFFTQLGVGGLLGRAVGVPVPRRLLPARFKVPKGFDVEFTVGSVLELTRAQRIKTTFRFPKVKAPEGIKRITSGIFPTKKGQIKFVLGKEGKFIEKLDIFREPKPSRIPKEQLLTPSQRELFSRVELLLKSSGKQELRGLKIREVIEPKIFKARLDKPPKEIPFTLEEAGTVSRLFVGAERFFGGIRDSRAILQRQRFFFPKELPRPPKIRKSGKPLGGEKPFKFPREKDIAAISADAQARADIFAEGRQPKGPQAPLIDVKAGLRISPAAFPTGKAAVPIFEPTPIVSPTFASSLLGGRIQAPEIGNIRSVLGFEPRIKPRVGLGRLPVLREAEFVGFRIGTKDFVGTRDRESLKFATRLRQASQQRKRVATGVRSRLAVATRQVPIIIPRLKIGQIQEPRLFGGIRSITGKKTRIVPPTIFPPTFPEPPTPLLSFDEDDPFRRKKKKRVRMIAEPRVSPSILGILSGITAPKAPRTVTGFGVRFPVARRKRRKGKR